MNAGEDPELGGTVASFWVDGVLFGVDIRQVREVLHDVDIEPVPGAPPGVLGLSSLRGQIVAAVDARQRLGLPPRRPDTPRAQFLISSGTHIDCLVVDREGDVIEVDRACIDPVPESLDPSLRSHVTFVCQRDDDLLLMLDIDGVLATPDAKGSTPHEGTGR